MIVEIVYEIKLEDILSNTYDTDESLRRNVLSTPRQMKISTYQSYILLQTFLSSISFYSFFHFYSVKLFLASHEIDDE